MKLYVRNMKGVSEHLCDKVFDMCVHEVFLRKSVEGEVSQSIITRSIKKSIQNKLCRFSIKCS